jgi:hypothetical protein
VWVLSYTGAPRWCIPLFQLINTRSSSVLLTGTASDAHTWNLVFLQKYIAEAGHEVVNLGPCVPESLLVDTCLRLRPDLARPLNTSREQGF